ncbi:MAG: FMN-binding protein [Catenulispora sp.]
MRRAIVTGTATVSGVVLLLGMKPHSQTPSAVGGSFTISSSDAQSSDQGSTAPSTGSSSGSGSTAGSGPSSGSGSSSSSGSSSTSGTKTVTGDAADTRYGPVQVAVTFNGKKITKIQVVEYPTESGRDREINSSAIPILNREAMSAQSANIDGVSGATYTAEGYQQSLQSAIDKANA